jgi:ABC-type polysaccharide/polyol phosphate export permease
MHLAVGIADLVDGLRRHELWRLLAWHDVKRGNARTRIGVLWHTLGFLITVGTLGFLYSAVFGQDTHVYVPYLAAGFLVWRFISAIATEGVNSLIAGRGLLTQMAIPVSVLPLRMVCYHGYLFGLNAIAFVLILGLYRILVIPHPLLLILGLFIVVCAGIATVLLAGIAAVFQRWLRNLIPSLMALVFFVTPILWMPNMLTGGDGIGVGLDLSAGVNARTALVLMNPFYYFVEIVRGPLLGYDLPIAYWLFAFGITVLLIGAALVLLSRMKSRILLNL